ncbi:MAG TPA: BON domain-containing protein [Polyangiaceae bacterium]|nr:BON domain-containing protein [Polyangiaceae bacterium]
MRHLGLFLMGSLALSACASQNTPPAASSSTVAQATNEPNRGPDFGPAASDGLATSPAERRTPSATQPTPAITPPQSGTTTQAAPPTQEFATGEREPAVGTSSGNAAAAPSDRSSAPRTDADNSRVNQRDRNSAALTPMDQGSSASDRAITQQIRKDLMNDKTLSFTAKNVKVITIDGKVTLRGPVKSEAERSAIEAAARRATGDGGRVDSQLEISK